MKDLKEIAENFRAKEKRANVIQDLNIEVRLSPKTVMELTGAIATLAERLDFDDKMIKVLDKCLFENYEKRIRKVEADSRFLECFKERLGEIETRFEGLLDFLGLAADGSGLVKRYAPGAEAGVRIETSPMVQHNARSNFGSQEVPIVFTDGEAHGIDPLPGPGTPVAVTTETDGEPRSDHGVPVEDKPTPTVRLSLGEVAGRLSGMSEEIEKLIAQGKKDLQMVRRISGLERMYHGLKALDESLDEIIAGMTK